MASISISSVASAEEDNSAGAQLQPPGETNELNFTKDKIKSV
jgi:hypothetical protein